MPIANSMPVPVSPKGMGKVGRTTFHPDGLGVRNVRLTRHILTVSTVCRISETKIVCEQIRYAHTETRSSILDTTEPIPESIRASRGGGPRLRVSPVLVI